MKLNDMIFVIENRKGTVETNFLLTLDDTIEMLKQSGEYSMKETAAIFSELGRTMTEDEEELKSKIARQYELNAQLDLENGKVEDVDLAASEDKDVAANVAEEKSPYRTGMDGYKR